MRWDTRLLLQLNPFFRGPKPPDRSTLATYAAWQHQEAGAQRAKFESLGVVFNGALGVDLGCGVGGKTVRLAEDSPGLTVGMDLAGPSLLAARRFATERGAAGARFVRADATRCPLRDGCADLVFATDTFEHFENPAAALAEAARLLRPGGTLALAFGPWGSPLGSHLYDQIFIPWCHLLFPRAALHEALQVLARRRSRTATPAVAAALLAAVERDMHHFDDEINRMTLARFRKLMRAEKRLEVTNWQTAPPNRLRALAPLLKIRGVDELLTGMLWVVARRSDRS